MDFSRASVVESDIGGAPGTVESNGHQEALQLEFEPGTDPVSLAVVKLISIAKNSSPVELIPLQSVIDVDSLNRLITGRSNGTPNSVSTSFHYEGFEVVVYGEGRIKATPRDRGK